MMLGTDINSLERKKLDLEIELNSLLKSVDRDEDKINELRSEILYLKKQISQKLGSKEVENQERLKRKKSGVDQRNVSNYNLFKSKYHQISKMEIATKRILGLIDIYQNKGQYQSQDSIMKVMSR